MGSIYIPMSESRCGWMYVVQSSVHFISESTIYGVVYIISYKVLAAKY